MTVTETNRSPRPRPPSTGMPLPFKRNTVPVCVPTGIFNFSSFSSVLTEISAPKRRLRKRYGHSRVEIASLPLKLLMLGHVNNHIEIACRTTCVPASPSP